MSPSLLHSVSFAIVAFIATMSSAATAALTEHSLKRIIPYELPPWAKRYLLKGPSHGRIPLANLPTPLFQVFPFKADSVLQNFVQNDISFYIKRDDMSGGVEIGGNKIRKLEFILADALRKGCDSIVTIGGEQSNHCRATAAAARMLGMEPHLILRTKRAQAVLEEKEDLGLTGNILFDRIVGSTIYTCTPGEYGRIGSAELVKRVCDHLESAQRKPYGIPVGGSNALGSFGYIEAVDELKSQWEELNTLQATSNNIDHIVFACGSGGTAAGIAVGIALAYGALEPDSQQLPIPKVHAIGVCDSPDYFYSFVAEIAEDMGLVLPSGMSAEEFLRQHMIVHQGKNLGYAVSTDEELDFICNFAQDTGVVLDPVYSGKSLYNFVFDVMQGAHSESFKGSNVIFIHTGGSLGMYDKCDAVMRRIAEQSPVKRLDVYGKGVQGSLDIHS